MDQVSQVCRRRHLSRRTEEAYRYWIRRYIYFHAKRHPIDVGTLGVAPFVNHLASGRQVAASTQSQALNAILFLYRDVLAQDIGRLDGLKRVQLRSSVPVVMTMGEVRDVLGRLVGTPRLMAELIYDAGLRVTEAVTLRVKDFDLATARRAASKIPQCFPAACVAIRIPFDLGAAVPGNREAAGLARFRLNDPARLQKGGNAGEHTETCQRAHASSFIRDASSG